VFTLRPYRPDDAPALLALFKDTIRRVNIRDYSPEQIWAVLTNFRRERVAVEAGLWPVKK
jgi:hypothetical protein